MPFLPWVATAGNTPLPLPVASGGTGGTSTATALANLGLAGPSNYPIPADFGWLAWTSDPGSATATALITLNTITLVSITLRSAATITNILATITTAGATLTAGQNFAGIYDSTGTQRGITADQSTNWQTAAGRVMALTSPISNAAAGTYYVAFVSNGTTAPTFRCSAATGTAGNLGLSGAGLRFATNGTGTTLPGSLTLGSNVATNATPILAVLS